MVTAAVERVEPASTAYRVTQLLVGILCMIMIANLQYGWKFFVPHLISDLHSSKALIGWAFTIFVAVETWLVPFEGWLIEKYGLGRLIFVGGAMSALGWGINAFAGSILTLYLGQIVAGLGAGIVYGGCVGNAVKWFPANRGQAAGWTAAGFGLGSALTIVPISAMIDARGYQSAFLVFGILQGAVVMLLALVLRSPRPGQVPIPAILKVQQTSRQVAPASVVRAPIFWLMYSMFVLVGIGGLMATANLALYSDELGVTKFPVLTLFGVVYGALVVASFVDNVTNGITRPICGWISDHIGRENMMFIAFLLEGIGILVLWRFASNPFAFVALTGIVFFAWGEIYSLFPSLATDLFGRQHATLNYGILYTAKGVAAVGVPLSGLLHDATGSWSAVLIVAAVFNLVAAALALIALKPMRVKFLARAGT